MDQPRLPALIIRAEPGAEETAVRVAALGVEPIVSPVLAYKARTDAPLAAPQAYSGLVFTSANGVRAFADRSDDRTRCAWCVGPATASAARNHGFPHVRESSGNAIDLARFIAGHSLPGSLPLLHVANAAAKGDFKQALTARGFAVEFAPLYDMLPAESLSAEALEVIATGTPAFVLIHSAKGAQSFVRLCGERPTSQLIAVAISEPASRSLLPLDLAALHISRTPNEDGLMTVLQSVIATLSA